MTTTRVSITEEPEGGPVLARSLALERIEKVLERERPDFEKLLDEAMEQYDDLYRRLA